MADAETAKAERTPTTLGFSPGHLCSFAGIIRVLNIILGAISIALWVPGYEHEFLGERNPNTGDTSKGYGNGFKRETLNQFVLAAIIICMISSVTLLLGLIAVQHASVDWNRVNKLAHAGLGMFLIIAGICSVFGTWYFQENCCHIDMSWSGVAGVRYQLDSGEGYVKHCYCWLTKYVGQSDTETLTDEVLYDPTRNPDTTGFNDRWIFAAHHIYPHVAAIFIIFINAILYLAGFVVSRNGRVTVEVPPPT